MRRNGRMPWRRATACALSLCILGACRAAAPTAERADHRDTVRRAAERPMLAQDAPAPPATPEPTEPVGPVTASDPNAGVTRESIAQQTADPQSEREVVLQQIADADREIREAQSELDSTPADDQARVARLRQRVAIAKVNRARLQSILERIDSVRRPRQISLTLQECIRRALEHNYAIRAGAFSPAIEATKIVEAEAAFDSVFFVQLNYNKQDRPSSSQLQGTLSDNRTFTSGVRKLLATGMTVQASYAANRTFSDLVFQTLNPSYFNQFIVEFRQPLLRNFGLDYNRAQIEVNKLERQSGLEQYRADLQKTLLQVEQAYWQLKQTRADLVVNARLLAEFERIYQIIESRRDFDTYQIQLGQIRSRLETRKAEFVARKAAVRDAEDLLKSLLNDPALNLADDVELIPVDPFALDPLVVDRLGEVQAALDHRPEIRQRQFDIRKARVGLGAAKNQALPKLDVTFRYIVDGLGGNWDNAFRQLADNDYHEYVVGLEFEWAIGNRAAEAGVRRARFLESQAGAAYGATIESVIREVHKAVRDVQVAYEQIGSTLRAAQASEDQLRATVARALSKDPATLEVELTANEALATSRSGLVNTLVNYTVSIVALEQAKGTLLEYDNIQLHEPEDPRPMVPSLGARKTD